MKRILILTVLAVVLLLAISATTFAQSSARSYIITASGNKLPTNLEAKVKAAGGVLDTRMDGIGLAVATSSAPNFAKKLEKTAGIRSVVPNLTLQWIDPDRTVVELEPDAGNPPISGDDDFFFDLQWGHDAVDAPEAWEAGARGAGVRVAVLDTGFDLDHPDLAPNINMALSADMTGEGLGYTLPDPFSHGTHVAGTIAAADNAFGTIGVAPEAELVLVKVLSDAGSGSFEDVIEGILYAADADADVINMSLGAAIYKNGDPNDPDGPYTAREAQELKNAIARAVAYAHKNGTTVITSAGNAANDGDHDKALIHIPSDAPQAISIAATAPIGWAVDPLNTFLDNPASYTNFGQSVIDFAAPGGDAAYPGNENCLIAGLVRPCWVFDLVFSTGSNLNPALASYYWSAGTSMAAPHASGVAALIIGANGGDMAPAQVEAALRASADDLGKPGNDDFYGAGRVNAHNYFEESSHPPLNRMYEKRLAPGASLFYFPCNSPLSSVS